MSDKILNLKGIKLTEISESEKVKLDSVSKKDIAIIGMDGRFAEMKDLEEFWDAVKSGKDCIRSLPKNRERDIRAFIRNQHMEEENQEFHVNAYMDDIDKFDYSFFNISPREAGLMDPNQRIFLETVWRAIEDSGYGGQSLKGSRTGVFLGDIGNSILDYKTMIYLEDKTKFDMSIPGNIKSIIASRISYIMDFKGPAVTVDTACSSSLVAVHMACQSLLSGECDLAIAGGINIRLVPIKSESTNIGIKSSDGKAKTFDDSSDGTGGGEGAAAIVLKPLSKALNDGDCIYAVIKGSASNQDGSSIGITAPSSLAQEDVIITAWRQAGINPETISYIEAHGTGTKLGDPIEIEGLNRAFRNFTNKKQFCSIGAVKTNIGHLDSAAGIAGLVKATLALKNRQIPPSLHFLRPNRRIDFEESPVYVNDILRDWDTDGFPRRCGISSFGLSGTNCHIVLEEAPTASGSSQALDMPLVFTLSAASFNSLKELTDSYLRFLTKDMDPGFGDICFTTCMGRGHYRFRVAILAKDKAELIEKLRRVSCLNEYPYMDKDIFFTKHAIVSGNKEQRNAFEIIADEKRDMSIESDEILKVLRSMNCEEYTQKLSRLCELYVRGAEINWKGLFTGKKFRRIHLPAYEFERERCWYADNTLDISNNCSYHSVRWQIGKQEADTLPIDNSGVTILLKDKDGMADKLKEALLSEKVNVIEVDLGTEFSKIDEHNYIISGSKQDYIRLFKSIENVETRNIIHMFTASGECMESSFSGLEKRLEAGIYNVFYLLGAINECSIKNKIHMTFVSRNAYRVNGMEENIVPENGALFGLVKVIGHEHSNLDCRCLDIGESKEVDEILHELKARPESTVCAYRHRKRYIEYFDTLNSEEIEPLKVHIKKAGAYVITGGTGGIGIETAKYFASKEKVNLVLINRSNLPKRSKWQSILENGEDKKLCNKIENILKIEETGSKVELISADVSIKENMEQVFEYIRNKYGAINGIVHGAGIAGEGFLFRKEEEAFRKVLYPKVHGTWVIEDLTKDDSLDFFVLFSSVTSLAGSPGQSDYTAANSFLDSFTAYRNKLGKRTLTINWPAWKEIGMAVEYGVDMKHSIMVPINTADAITAFDTLLNSSTDRAVVGNINYEELGSRLEKASINLSESILANMEKHNGHYKTKVQAGNQKKQTNVKLKGNDGETYTDTQRKIAGIWADILGLKEVSIYSNFNELGGDSIIAAHLAREIESEFPGMVHITDIFSYPTISELAKYIDKSHMDSSTKNEINVDDVLDRLEKGNLTVEEAAELMEMVGDKEWKL